MSKTLRTAAIIVGAVALTVSTFGIGAAPAAAGTTSTITVGTTTVSYSVGATAATGANILGVSAATLGTISSGLAMASTALAQRPFGTAGGNQTSFKADPSAGIPYAIGRTLVGGNIVFHKAHGKDNRYKTIVTVLSGGGPIEGIEAMHVEQVPVAFAGTAATGGYAGWMWQATQLGATPEVAALAVPGPAEAPAAAWGALHKLSGYAASIWTLRYDSKGKVFAAGTPQPGWLGKWVKVYDPRLDDVFPGGAGACRALDEATYVWSDNPWLHALTFALGRWQNGQRILGLGAPVAAIDIAAFVEAANIAEANGWKAGGVVYSTDPKWDVMKQFAQAGGGQVVMLGARLSCIVNAPRVSLATIAEGDIVGEASVAATQPRRSRFNSVVPRYRSEAHNWEIVTGTPIKVAEHVAEDGGERRQEIAYPLVQSFADEDPDAPRQIAQLARYDIENAREFGPVTLPLKPRWLGYRPGDCVTADVEELGLVNQALLITNRSLDPASGIVTLTAMSETHGKHAFALGQVSAPPPTPGVTGDTLNTVPAPASDAWEAEGSEFSDNGATIPAIVVTGAADNPNAEAVLFELQVDGESAWATIGMAPASTTRREITGITPGTGYLVGVSYRVRGVIGARRVLGPVTAGQLLAGAAAQVPWAGVNDRPAELTDGRIPGALNSDGTIKAGKVLASSIADLVLTDTKFAPGYEPVRRVSALPSPSGYAGPALVYLTTDGKLYRYAAGAWTAAIAAVDISGQLADAQLASLAASKISGALTDAQLSAISAAKVTGTLSDAQLASIAAAKVSGQIVSTQVADGAIGTPKLAAGAVTAAKIAAGSITAGEIAAATITGGNIATATITASHLLAGTITGGHIAAGTISGGNIAAATIAGGHIAAGTLTAAHILAGSITGDRVAAGTIEGSNIAANTITGGKILAGSVSGDRIQAYTLTADRLVANSITAAQLATSGLITASAQIADGVITNAKIGGTLQSDDYVSGTAGWRILKSGAAEFNNIVLSRNQIAGSGHIWPSWYTVGAGDGVEYLFWDDWIDTGVAPSVWDTRGPMVGNARLDPALVYSWTPKPGLTVYTCSVVEIRERVAPEAGGFATVQLRVKVTGINANMGTPIHWTLFRVT